MPICKHCGKDAEDLKTTTCFNGYIEYQDHTALSRVPYSEDEEERCSVCNVIPGATHHKDCYMEKCTICGMRLVSCGCIKRDGQFRLSIKINRCFKRYIGKKFL